MLSALTQLYDHLILKRPVYPVLVCVLITLLFASYIPDFKLDASADSLVLENDKALKFYRSIKARYGSDDFLIITYTPEKDLFSEPVLNDIRKLRDDIKKLPRIDSVVSILDVPLTQSPPVSLAELSKEIRTLETPGIDIQLARSELLTSPLYSNMLISLDAGTTAIQVNFKRDETYHKLLIKRNSLREKQLAVKLKPDEQHQLELISKAFKDYNYALQDQETRLISDIRKLMIQHGSQARLHLGGVPMIASDSIDFIQNDMKTFGIGVVIFIVVILAVAFRKVRWIILPMLTCFISGVIMTGLLGLLDWRVTVVSSNFISLLLIINLSLTIHLIVRYRELRVKAFSSDQQTLILETVRSKFAPSFYTAITTMVAFASLLVSDIRPVIDFGWMMVMGVTIAFIISFVFFPALLMFFKPGPVDKLDDLTGYIISQIATVINRYNKTIVVLFVLFSVFSVLGISLLTVENRFIDYYKKQTEIYQGMELIDQKLGGTTPMDIVISAPASFFKKADEVDSNADFSEFSSLEEELEFELEDKDSGGITASSYWFNYNRMETIKGIHNYLDQLPETGKVLSIYTSVSMLEQLKNNQDLDDFFLSLIYKRVPHEMQQALFTPYMLLDGNQLRFSLRLFESDKNLQRNKLIEKIRLDLMNKFNIQAEQIQLTGMAVLYNNMLQSLFASQIKTIGVIFIAIMIMFAFLFRSIPLACVAIIPNMLPAVMMLGLMGLAGIPLDIMTITIAAICIGIAVDDTIHYVHRFKEEFVKDSNYLEATKRCHSSIGRAMYFTTVTLTLGFSILVFSNFVPIIYFGLLTGFAILVALLADLTLLPVLLRLFKPLGREN
ncbi:MAG: MMPL family transporter [Gammaproteobacteria bacterium]|nr:MMPL family transporter [Gammaproteobacteria bacterium]